MEDFKEIVYDSAVELSLQGKMEQWRESFQENVACADFLKEQIWENYQNSSLNTQAVLENTAEQFGVERTKMILAHTIEYFAHDGRISSQNKEWAKGVETPHNELNYAHQYVVEEQGMIDMLARKMQAIEPELLQNQEKQQVPDLFALTSTDLQKLMENDPKLAFMVQEAVDYLKINDLLYDKLPEADLQYVNQVADLFREQESVDKVAVYEFVAEALNHSDLQIDDLKMLDFSDFRSAFDEKDVNLLISNVDLAYEQAEISKLNTPEALESIQQYFEEPISTENLKNLNELANKTAMRSEENSPELIKEYLIGEINEGKISFVDLYFLTPYDVEQAVNSHQGILVDREVQLENVVARKTEATEIPASEQEALSFQEIKELAQGKEPELSSLSVQELVELMQNDHSIDVKIREANDISIIADSLEETLPFEDMATIHSFATDVWLKYEDTSKVEITDFISNAINEGEITVSDLDNISRSEFFDCLTDDNLEQLGELAQERREPEKESLPYVDFENQLTPEQKLQQEAGVLEVGYVVGENVLYFSKMEENDPNILVGVFGTEHQNMLSVDLVPDMSMTEAINEICKNYDLPDLDSLRDRSAPDIDIPVWHKIQQEALKEDGIVNLGDYTLLVEKNPDMEGYVRAELFDKDNNSLFAVADHDTIVHDMIKNYENYLTEDLLGGIDPADLDFTKVNDDTFIKLPAEPFKETLKLMAEQEQPELPQDIMPVPDQENFFATTLTTQERVVIEAATEHAQEHWQDIPEEYREVLEDILAKIDPEMNLLDFYPEDYDFPPSEALQEQITMHMTTEELLVIADVCEGASQDWEEVAENYRDTLDGVVDKITSLELDRPDEIDLDTYRYELEFPPEEMEMDDIQEDFTVTKGTREYFLTQENLEQLEKEGFAEISYTDVTPSGQEYKGTEDFSAERWEFIQQEPRMVAGYTITTSELVGDVEVAMGENDQGFYGTWVAYPEADQSKGLVDNWNFGHYFTDEDKAVNREQAMEDFKERVADNLPQKSDKNRDSEEKPKKPSVLQALKDEKEKSKAEKQKTNDEPDKIKIKSDKKEER